MEPTKFPNKWSVVAVYWEGCKVVYIEKLKSSCQMQNFEQAKSRGYKNFSIFKSGRYSKSYSLLDCPGSYYKTLQAPLPGFVASAFQSFGKPKIVSLSGKYKTRLSADKVKGYATAVCSSCSKSFNRPVQDRYSTKCSRCTSFYQQEALD